MALRLRRGTDDERLTIIPAEGELIYTTDLQELWIGDGITAGGNKVTGVIPKNLSDLEDVDPVLPEMNQVLRWNGERWEPSDDESSGVVEDASYKINILDSNNVTIVNSNTATFSGNFVGDGSGLTNLPIAPDGSGIVEGSNYRINIVDDSSTVMLDTSTTTFTGNFVGDGSGLTNVPVDPDTNIIDGGTYQINVIGVDSSVMIDSLNNIVTAENVNGETITASENLIAGNINTSRINSVLETIEFGNTEFPTNLSFNVTDSFKIESTSDSDNPGGFIVTNVSRGTLENREPMQPNDMLGGLLFRGYTDAETSATGGVLRFLVDPSANINGGSFIKTVVSITASSDTEINPANSFLVNSDGVASTNGVISNKFMQLAVYNNDTERSNLIPSPEKGMMIFIENGSDPVATNQIQLYNGTNWINIT